MLVTPAFAYALPVFAAGFVLGALRTLWLAPMVGPLAAVAMELPVILAVSWFVAGAVLRRWSLPRAERLVMGAIAFVILMACEAGLSLGFGRTLRDFAADMATAHGALGLAGQIAFALIPRFRP